jgi:hypothetical protein
MLLRSMKLKIYNNLLDSQNEVLYTNVNWNCLQEEIKESKEVKEEMITDTECKDQVTPETETTDTAAVFNSVTLKSEQSSAPSEICNKTSETTTSQLDTLPSTETSMQPDTVNKSEVQSTDETSNQSEDKSHINVTPSGDNSNQSETVSHHEATPSDDNSNQTDGSSGRKSPAFDMSTIKIKNERTDSTESGMCALHCNSKRFVSCK